MESSLRPKIDASGPSFARHNRAGHVVEYTAGGKSMKNLNEPSYPQNMGFEGWPSAAPQTQVGEIAGKKAAEGFASVQTQPEPSQRAVGKKGLD